MPNFNSYLARHGEGWVLFIVEQIERSEGVNRRAATSLEDRWNTLAHGGCATAQRMAA
jgi:hypothetical protein